MPSGIYAARGRYSVLTSILQNREELITVVDEDGDEISAPDYEALFHGRRASTDSRISVGPEEPSQQLSIKYDTGPLLKQRTLLSEDSPNGDEPMLKIEFQGIQQEIPVRSFFRESHLLRHQYRRFRDDESERPSEIRCLSLGPSLPTNADITRFWDSVALTDDEDRAVQALQLIYDDEVSRVAVVDDDRRPRYGRRAVVKINGQDRPIPLKSLGDGAVRLFGVALALANSQDGFLVIDEAENGIHHSVQRDFWKMVMRTAHENNVQVLATTHGWDCVAGFARAATESEQVEGALVRLERNDDGIRAVGYSEEDLRVAAEQGIEVR